MPTITPFLWFDDKAEEAMHFYISIFPDGKVLNVLRYGNAGAGPAGVVMTAQFSVAGQEFIALNGGPHFAFSEAISFVINCKDQREIDYYWSKLTADGGKESKCGWLIDKYGLSWQVVPTNLAAILTDKDPKKSDRAVKALMGMVKLDIAALEAARDGR